MSEASPFAVVQVSLSNASTTPIGFTPLLLSGSATTGTDTGSSLEFFDTTDSQWQNAAAAVSIAAGSTSLLLRTTITNDGIQIGHRNKNRPNAIPLMNPDKLSV